MEQEYNFDCFGKKFFHSFDRIELIELRCKNKGIAKELLENSIYPTEEEFKKEAEAHFKAHHLEFMKRMLRNPQEQFIMLCRINKIFCSTFNQMNSDIIYFCAGISITL